MLRLRYNGCGLMTSDFWEEDHSVVGRIVERRPLTQPRAVQTSNPRKFLAAA
jgi:hypothetical protein